MKPSQERHSYQPPICWEALLSPETTPSNSPEVPVSVGLFPIPSGDLGVTVFPNILSSTGILFILDLQGCPTLSPSGLL